MASTPVTAAIVGVALVHEIVVDSAVLYGTVVVAVVVIVFVSSAVVV